MKSIKYYTLLLCLLCTSSLAAGANANSSLVSLDLNFTSVDTAFTRPYIDIDEWRNTPIRHHYIHGGFRNNGTKFSFYFPEKQNYKGHFFQYITPFPDNENICQAQRGAEDKISFAVSHGAYFIETNEGGPIDFTHPAVKSDISSYRANAACGEFSRVVAEKIYGCKRPYGYAFGGSGGAYRTVGGMESTNTWDGVVPYVMGSPMAIPNVFTVRLRALRILNDKFPQIIDAVDAGGSGDMYAGLNDEEKSVLKEVTAMGMNPQGWYGYKRMGLHGFLVLYQSIKQLIPDYFKDFWTTSGYLGYDHPELFKEAKVIKETTIKAPISNVAAANMGLVEPITESERGTADAAWKKIGGTGDGMPVAFQLGDEIKVKTFLCGDLIIKSGAAKGASLMLTKVDGDKVVLGPTASEILVKVKPGDTVVVDNSNLLAIETLHWHQVPSLEYKVWNQFRDSHGNPLYPQLKMQLGPLFTKSAAGILPTGKFNGKMILLSSHMDREAFPWQCDWYRSQVKKHLGEKTDDNFRLWYTDHALHGDVSIEDDPTRVVSYLGVLQQALLDLSNWVEHGVAPAKTTNYQFDNGQIDLPSIADARSGIQPVVNIRIKGNNVTHNGKRIDVKAGETVCFEATVSVPSGTGHIVRGAWNFDGIPENTDYMKMYLATKNQGWDYYTSSFFPEKVVLPANAKTKNTIIIKCKHTFTKSGTFFPTLRVDAQRDGNASTVFTRIQNLDRCRVVVE
jgi:hypothetical protein